MARSRRHSTDNQGREDRPIRWGDRGSTGDDELKDLLYFFNSKKTRRQEVQVLQIITHNGSAALYRVLCTCLSAARLNHGNSLGAQHSVSQHAASATVASAHGSPE